MFLGMHPSRRRSLSSSLTTLTTNSRKMAEMEWDQVPGEYLLVFIFDDLASRRVAARPVPTPFPGLP